MTLEANIHLYTFRQALLYWTSCSSPPNRSKLEEKVAGTSPNVLGANQSPRQVGAGCDSPSCRQGGSAALRGGGRAAEWMAWHLEKVHWVTLIRSHIMAREGAGWPGLLQFGLVVLWIWWGCVSVLVSRYLLILSLPIWFFVNRFAMVVAMRGPLLKTFFLF